LLAFTYKELFIFVIDAIAFPNKHMDMNMRAIHCCNAAKRAKATTVFRFYYVKWKTFQRKRISRKINISKAQ